MADFEELSFSYLGLLSNAHHDGTTQQIDDCCGNFETENQVFLRKAQTLHQCRVKEDEAWKKSKIKGSLIFFSKSFAYFRKCLYLCAIITKLKSYHYAKKAKRI